MNQPDLLRLEPDWCDVRLLSSDTSPEGPPENLFPTFPGRGTQRDPNVLSG